MHAEGLMSLPTDRSKSNALDFLTGRPHELWHHWPNNLLRGPDEPRELIRPYFDQQLRRGR
eukprot:553467-Pyramimonas_sp.AAC.1